MKNITSILLIIAAIGIFFFYSKPKYEAAAVRRAELKTYQDTLKKVEELEEEIARIETKIEAIDPEERERLEKLIPVTINNVNLIIDINNIASNFGLAIRDIDIEEAEEEEGDERTPVARQRDNAPYNSIDLSFTVTSSYANFVDFINDLEKSLRIVDITKITFTPGDSSNYNFKVTLRTYWLK